MPLCPHCQLDHPEEVDYCPYTGRPLMDVVERMIGRVIAGKYRLLRAIGQGGMGTIFMAEHTLIGNRVAVKLLHEPFGKEREPVERLYREARATGTIGHRNIIKVHDVGETNEGVPFLVMELLEGQSLGQYIEQHGPCSLDRVFDVAIQILSALHAAHSAGIIHRDLKSENIFLVQSANPARAQVKILDFGISKFSVPDPKGLKLTQTGSILGTPYYMSPEQACGYSDLDARLDLYAAGVILYEMLLGTMPYDATNYNALLLEISTCDVQPFRHRRPDIPEDLQAAVLKALARDRALRWPRALDFMEALSRIRDRLGPNALAGPPRIVEASLEQSGQDSRLDRAWLTVGNENRTPLTVETDDLTLTDPLGRIRGGARRLAAWIGAVAGLSVGLLVLFGNVFNGSDQYEGSPNRSDGASAKSPSASRPADPGQESKGDGGVAAARSVRLTVLSTPAHAEVFAGDRPVPKEGIDLVISAEPVEVLVRALGFVPQTSTVIPVEDLEIRVDLKPVSKKRRSDKGLGPKKKRNKDRSSSKTPGAGSEKKDGPHNASGEKPRTEKSMDRLMDNPF